MKETLSIVPKSFDLLIKDLRNFVKELRGGTRTRVVAQDSLDFQVKLSPRSILFGLRENFYENLGYHQCKPVVEFPVVCIPAINE